MLCDVQDAERRQAETRAKQQQRQKEMEAAQQEAQERRQLLEEQKLLKLAGMPPSSFTAPCVQSLAWKTVRSRLHSVLHAGCLLCCIGVIPGVRGLYVCQECVGLFER